MAQSAAFMSGVPHEFVYKDKRRVKYEYLSESLCRWGVGGFCCSLCCWGNLVCAPALCCVGVHNRDPNIQWRLKTGFCAMAFVCAGMGVVCYLAYTYAHMGSFPPICYHEHRELCGNSTCVSKTAAAPILFSSSDHHWLIHDDGTTGRTEDSMFFEYGSQQHCVYGLGPALSTSIDTCHSTILSSATDSTNCAYYESDGQDTFVKQNLVGLTEWKVTYTFVLPHDSDDYAQDSASLICTCLGGADAESWLADYRSVLWLGFVFQLCMFIPHLWILKKLNTFTELGKELVGDPVSANALLPGVMEPYVPYQRPRALNWRNLSSVRPGGGGGSADDDLDEIEMEETNVTQGTMFGSSGESSAGSQVVGRAVKL